MQITVLNFFFKTKILPNYGRLGLFNYAIFSRLEENVNFFKTLKTQLRSNITIFSDT